MHDFCPILLPLGFSRQGEDLSKKENDKAMAHLQSFVFATRIGNVIAA